MNAKQRRQEERVKHFLHLGRHVEAVEEKALDEVKKAHEALAVAYAKIEKLNKRVAILEEGVKHVETLEAQLADKEQEIATLLVVTHEREQQVAEAREAEQAAVGRAAILEAQDKEAAPLRRRLAEKTKALELANLENQRLRAQLSKEQALRSVVFMAK